jgi:hypothetical protein
MTSAPDFRAGAAWIALGPWLVGATFLWAGGIKAVAPHVFREHLSRLGWVPNRFIQYLVPATAGLETAWGMALILGVASAVVLPATAALLVALTAMSWWGVRSGRTTDCGCYGGYVVPSIAQSVMLNGAFIALVILAWLIGPPAGPTAGPTADWKLFVMGAAGIGFAGLAAASQQFLRKHGRMMIDTSPLRVGRRWSKRWGAGIPDDGREMLVSYLGPDCPYCKQWVRVLNAMDQSPGLPRVTGIVAASQEKLETFIQNSGIRFPMVTIPQTLMSRLVWGVPTTVLVSSGVIKKQWGGHMPPEFFNRFREAFFPLAAKTEARVGAPVKTST